MNQLFIRRAVREDLPDILSLYKQPGIDDNETLSIPAAQEQFNRILSYPNYNIYAAFIDGKIVGTFELLIMDNLAHMGAPSGIVEDVVVDNNYRNLGIGKQMMEFALEKCREAGCYKLTLSSNIKRERAHAFYDNLGFQRHGYSFLMPIKSV